MSSSYSILLIIIFFNVVNKCEIVFTVAVMLEGLCSGSRVYFQIWECI
jgi:hypothetical protein